MFHVKPKILGTVQSISKIKNQPQTEAANAARAHVMRGVLSPSGTRLAPTEAARRPVACCFERPE